ncbi:AhpC-TSA-domain-containing protein [Guyanagaster necrorhizus]|uniref:thioredoxin-dependent peroxiredoxin n=1 Tax=Guyanagaster necrorhizus TaxID=856835 RepID=A0A9P8ALZ1_9AGAR|nr:AhpC-TSA-domain-containing protein [Guyanagaster necrorhizus MCA 3950]KAG7440179.1 AhpC-TSA-domain-containing protein [Guyanagaster necrorhizus MCA 3950]
MARKAAAEAITTEPRRSTRILSQPAPKAKRKADGEGGRAKKKTKKVAEDMEESAQEKAEQLQIGSSLAGLSITLPNQKGEDVEIGMIASERGVVLFLVPRADTPGCTQQACAYRDAYDKFTEAGYDVYCLSADEEGKQGKWKDKKTLPYDLLSDPKRVFISALGAGTTKTARSHFVFAKGGVMIDKRMPVKPAESFKLALDAIQKESEKGDGGTKEEKDDKKDEGDDEA